MDNSSRIYLMYLSDTLSASMRTANRQSLAECLSSIYPFLSLLVQLPRVAEIDGRAVGSAVEGAQMMPLFFAGDARWSVSENPAGWRGIPPPAAFPARPRPPGSRLPPTAFCTARRTVRCCTWPGFLPGASDRKAASPPMRTGSPPSGRRWLSDNFPPGGGRAAGRRAPDPG